MFQTACRVYDVAEGYIVNNLEAVMKVSIIGAGAVGVGICNYLLSLGDCRELVVVDLNRERSEGEQMDFSHVSAGSTRKIYFAQGEPALPSGYVVPEPEEPAQTEEPSADDTTADGAEDAAAQPAGDTAAAEETPLTDPARMTANETQDPM